MSQEPVIMGQREQFYFDTITQFIPDRSSSILIVAAGSRDREIFQRAGYVNVVISNLDDRIQGDEYLPYQWSYQDAERLTYEDDAFDYVVIHAGLHHCHSPHRALLEMYRVASKGVVAIENRDIFTMKVMHALRLSGPYEVGAVFYSDCSYGGVGNTHIPNFVYRWTENEIEKTIKSFAPHLRHVFKYRYGLALPAITNKHKRFGLLKKSFIYMLIPFYKLYALMFPKQQNLFSFYINKPDITKDLQPWLMLTNEGIVFNKAYGASRFKKV